MQALKLILCIFAIAVLSSEAVRAKQVVETEASLAITISLPHDHVSSQSNVLLEVTISNNSGSWIILPSLRQFTAAAVTIFDSNKRAVSPKNIPSGPLAGSRFGMGIPPNGKHVEFLYLIQTYDLHKPGRYSIQVHEKDHESGETIESNVVQLDVLP